MSMSVTEILINCERQFSILKKDIDFVMNQINHTLEICKEIDNSNIYREKLTFYKKKFVNLMMEINENAFEQEISKDTHVAIETHNKIKNFLERKRQEIASLKNDVNLIKEEVLKEESSKIKEILNTGKFTSLEEIKNFIIEQFSEMSDKFFISNWFISNQEKITNSSKEQIVQLISGELKNLANGDMGIINRAIYAAKELYGPQDVDVLKEIANDIEDLKSSSNDIPIYTRIEHFNAKIAKKAEDILTRKDNVIKIIKSIRSLGYQVTENDVRKFEKDNIISINATKDSGEQVQFAVQLDGKFLINSEGFDREDHDIEFKNIINELKENGLSTTTPLEVKYREPKYVAKHQNIKKKSNESK